MLFFEKGEWTEIKSSGCLFCEEVICATDATNLGI